MTLNGCAPDEVVRVADAFPSAFRPTFVAGHGRDRQSVAPLARTVESEPADLPSLSPEQLAEKSKTGCRDSFESLVELFECRIFNFLFQMTRNRHDAEDLTQDTFLKAYRNIHRYNPACSFATWLFTIAKRTGVSHFRSMRPTEEIQADSEAAGADPSATLAEKDERRSLWQLASALKPKQFEALWLHYAEGFSTADVAQIMRLTPIHVKVLLHRGRQRLGELLSKHRETVLHGNPSDGLPDRAREE